jgi:hypothetical protein
MCSCCSQERHLLHFSVAIFKENCLCMCGFQVNIAVLFKAYSVVFLWKYTHALVFVLWVAWQNSINRTLMKANNYNVVTTTMVNGLFEVTSITLAVKRQLTCLIYLVWGNWKKSSVLFCARREDRLFLNCL